MPTNTEFTTVGSDGTLILPSAARRSLSLERDATLAVVTRDDGVVELHPSVAAPAAVSENLADFWEQWWAVAAEATDEAGTGP